MSQIEPCTCDCCERWRKALRTHWTEPEKGESALPTLLSCDLVPRMEDEAKQFKQCSERHDRRGNDSAADVAWRAYEILTGFAAELKRDNGELALPTLLDARDIRAAAMNIVNQVLDASDASVAKRQSINDRCDELAIAVINQLVGAPNIRSEP